MDKREGLNEDLKELGEKRKEYYEGADEELEELGEEMKEEEQEKEKCLQEWLKEYKVEILNPDGVNDLEHDLTKIQFFNLLKKCNIRVKYNSPLKEMWGI